MEENYFREQDSDLIFALDIGTRSVIGVIGKMEGDRLKVLAIEREEHKKRAMVDGQIENIELVADVARIVTGRLEEKLQVHFSRVCVAAAGRSLKTTTAHFKIELPKAKTIDEDLIGQLEAGAVSEAERSLFDLNEERRQFFMVGYTVSQYQLDHYPMSTLLGHNGTELEADIVGTFLPNEVVESLYSAMRLAKLEIVSLTLEPIAAMNAAIPAELRLLNLVLADIGAGTSDIAVCRDGSIVSYTMATLAGDEITEAIMREFLVDFATAEQLKQKMRTEPELSFKDILGFEQTVSVQEVEKVAQNAADSLADEVARKIVEINGGAPSALFLSGGGSKLVGLRELMAKFLNMDMRRIAIAGANFEKSAFSDNYELNDPEYATPLGIAISAGMGLINNSYVVMLNGQPAKLFHNGTLTIQEILLMNGYTYVDMIGRSGPTQTIKINGQKCVFRGKPATPAVLKCNGKDVSATTVVYAGDEITFVPATHGLSELHTVREVLGMDFTGKVYIDGMECDLDTPLHSGDDLTAEPDEAFGEFTLDSDELESAEPDELDEAEDGDEKAEPVSVSAGTHEYNYTSSISIDTSAAAGQETEPGAALNRNELTVILNEVQRSFPAKEDGSPYYLMDMLQFSGIDFEHLKRPVLLKINGQNGLFQQILQNGDIIEIRCQ